MADDDLPQTIREALSTAFSKKPAEKLDEWAQLCAQAGIDNVDDVQAFRAQDFDTWVGCQSESRNNWSDNAAEMKVIMQQSPMMMNSDTKTFIPCTTPIAGCLE